MTKIKDLPLDSEFMKAEEQFQIKENMKSIIIDKKEALKTLF
jgi:hypothetical protein